MILQVNFEFRGSNTNVNNDTGKSYTFLNLEDSNGESCKFLASQNFNEFELLEKGTKYNFILDYNPKYSSIRVIGVN